VPAPLEGEITAVSPDELKRAAAREALQAVRSGMVLGLGTGSTVKHFVDLLAERLDSGALHDVVGVPTSLRTERQARDLGVPLAELSEHQRLDLTVDGADEISPELDLIKGLGGALLREKMVAQASDRLIIISDDRKLVPGLGQKVPLPVEVVGWAWDAHIPFLEALGADVRLRTGTDDEPVWSDNGTLFLDCSFLEGIPYPAELERTLLYRAGVVDTGLFLGMATSAVIASAKGITTMHRP
jgi:ribose 5-phosphate isomerase A